MAHCKNWSHPEVGALWVSRRNKAGQITFMTGTIYDKKICLSYNKNRKGRHPDYKIFEFKEPKKQSFSDDEVSRKYVEDNKDRIDEFDF